MRGRIFVPTVAVAVAAVLAVGALRAPSDAADLTYPVTQLAQLAAGQSADFTNPQLGLYEAQAGFADALARTVANTQALLNPAQYEGPDGTQHLLANLQTLIDDTTKAAPTGVGSSYVAVGSPYLMVDWSHHPGILGTPADYGIDNSAGPAEGTFPYPCIAETGVITYKTATGTCVAADAAGATFVLGRAQKVTVVDSRGLRLAATLWLPAAAVGAVGGVGAASAKFPGVVFSDGFGSRQADYYMYPMTLAEAGFIVLTYDEAGQGQSDGGILELEGGPAMTECAVPGACRDLEDITRWFVGSSITPVPDNIARLTPRANPLTDNTPNRAAALLDVSHIGLIGQSMGSLATTDYLAYLGTGDGHGADGRPLPPIAAAVALSGFVPLNAAPVPIQAQTADLDLPGATATNGPLGVTDGPVGTSAWYDQIEGSHQGSGGLELIITESGSHFDTTSAPYTPHAVWGPALSVRYAGDWFGCYLANDPAACADATTPQPHLSQAYASEFDLDGPAGAAPSRCLTVPTQASLEQIESPNLALLAALGGAPPYDCKP